jgi:glycosyltransferase involved in cell wall biosynthesis
MNHNSINMHHEKPTILYAIGSLSIGGAEKQMALLIGHLDEMNFNCHLFALEPFGPLNHYLRTTNVTIHDGGYFSEKSWIIKILLLIRAQFRLLHVIKKTRPDVMHAYLPLTNFMGSLAGRIARVPLIITSKRALGNHQRRYRGWRIFDIAAFRLSHVVTANSKAVGEDTLKRDRGCESKIRLIYNGVQSSIFNNDDSIKRRIRRQLHLNPNKNVIITVANLLSYKGHHELIEAAARVTDKYPDSHFLLIGEDRGIRKDLEIQVKEHGIDNKIIFLGQRNDIPDLLAASDISVLPSHEEGFSNVILESMAAGLPVVATNVGGNPEAIVNGETGWLVPPKNPEELALKIADLLHDPEKAKKWGEAGRHRVQIHFSDKKMLEEYIKLYQK